MTFVSTTSCPSAELDDDDVALSLLLFQTVIDLIPVGFGSEGTPLEASVFTKLASLVAERERIVEHAAEHDVESVKLARAIAALRRLQAARTRLVDALLAVARAELRAI
jgi:hypothetical protein